MAWGLLLVLLVGCGEKSTAEERSGGALVDHNDWVVSTLGADFFGAIPEEICEPEVSYRAEELGGEFVFAIETEFCSYLTVEQPARLAIKAGDSIKVRLYHAPLTGPPDSLAHMGLAIGEETSNKSSARAAHSRQPASSASEQCSALMHISIT